jgi:hypothetical protein
MGKSCSNRLVLVGVVLAACWNPSVGSGEGYGLEVAALSEIVRRIVSNPGPIEAICINLTNGTARDSALPDLEADHSFGNVELLPADGCEEVEGVLRKRGGGQAISVTTRTPKLDGGDRARVQVITSTGSRDVAAYRCTLRRSGNAWTLQQCKLEAVT